MKANEVHKMNNDELNVEEQNLRKRLYELRSQAVTQKLDNPGQLSAIRRDVARILTERRSRQIKQEVKV